MINDLLSFENKKERNDFLIALVVIAFFGWLFFQFGVFGKKDQIPNSPIAASAAILDFSDKDKDGISDEKDNCPTLAGLAEFNGCPADTDGDGVYDNEDRCPELAGLAIRNGCPADSDGDGVYDLNDKCPNVKGDDEGCPPNSDRDGDGILDKKDKCPKLAGIAENNGCPADADADGVYDTDDKCPELAGIVENNGCPADSDADGVYDTDDKCPKLAGVTENGGCPADADRDGVYDTDDKCPKLAGVKENNGCPADSDNDGIYDSLDRCPNKAGLEENGGCPEVKLAVEDKAIIERAIKGVHFVPAQAILTEYSMGIINDVYKLLEKNPDYRLEISGHTDSIGEEAGNLQLSKDRAESCKKILVALGIDASRLTAQGFGETKPVATNKTKAGQLLNRRVDFKVKY